MPTPGRPTQSRPGSSCCPPPLRSAPRPPPVLSGPGLAPRAPPTGRPACLSWSAGSASPRPALSLSFPGSECTFNRRFAHPAAPQAHGGAVPGPPGGYYSESGDDERGQAAVKGAGGGLLNREPAVAARPARPGCLLSPSLPEPLCRLGTSESRL